MDIIWIIGGETSHSFKLSVGFLKSMWQNILKSN